MDTDRNKFGSATALQKGSPPMMPARKREPGKSSDRSERVTATDYKLGATLARFLHDKQTGRVGLLLLPADMKNAVTPRRTHLRGVEIDAYATAMGTTLPAWSVDSMVQVKSIDDDPSPAFAQGRTLRNSVTIDRLRFLDRQVRKADNGLSIRTTFEHERGWKVHHDLRWRRSAPWMEASTVVENTSNQPLTLELLASASLDGITPFASDAAAGRLWLHRFRSVWSMEGRMVSEPLESLQLEPSWAGWGVRCERFGVVGSMPVNGWFPRALLEDRGTGVTWGIQVVHNGTWQIEAYRRGDTLSLSGGLGDAEFGHWRSILAPGERLASPTAQLACVCGGPDEACDALNSAQLPPMASQPRKERSLPVVFNEWATTWGKPSHESMLRLAKGLRGLGVRYLVMDAGWYAPAGGEWGAAHGDWEPNPQLYPQGLRATADAIRAIGLVPGIWFEMETCGADSALYHRTELLLHRDGRPITTGKRRHLDLRKPEVTDYLAERVIGVLKTCGFGYLKIDYNDTVGIGPDHPDSPGEGLREQLEASRAFLARIRAELPDLVIENCSSGGHRLEPSLFALSSMSSFSDAHESPEIPIIAANLHRLMLPRQSQIWAVLRSGETVTRTGYSLAAGFLGRLCLSGDLPDWSAAQRSLVRQATILYRRSKKTIRDGRSRIYGPRVLAYRRAEGWQAVIRERIDRRELLIVAHTFSRPGRKPIELPLPEGRWKRVDMFSVDGEVLRIRKRTIEWVPGGEWRGVVARLERVDRGKPVRKFKR